MKAFIEQCESCNTYQPCQTKEPMLSHLVPNQPWSRIAGDLFAWEGMNFVLLVDYYSDWWEIEKLTDLSSKSVVKNIKRIFARFGIPPVLISDNGPQFVSYEFREFMAQWGVDKVFSSPHYQQGNGKAESAVKIAKNLLRKTLRSKQDFWTAVLEWRNTPTAGVNTSPAKRLLARRTRTTLPMASRLLKPEVSAQVETHDRLIRKNTKQKYFMTNTPRNFRSSKLAKKSDYDH